MEPTDDLVAMDLLPGRLVNGCCLVDSHLDQLPPQTTSSQINFHPNDSMTDRSSGLMAPPVARIALSLDAGVLYVVGGVGRNVVAEDIADNCG